MSLIKSWKDFFKAKQDFDDNDIQDLTDLFEYFLEELFINKDFNKEDLDFSIEIDKPKVIKAQIIINPSIRVNGRSGSMIRTKVLYDIIESKEMVTLRDQIKRNYNLFDTSDEITKLKKKSGRMDQLFTQFPLTDSEMQIFMIEQLGTIFFTITPK